MSTIRPDDTLTLQSGLDSLTYTVITPGGPPWPATAEDVQTFHIGREVVQAVPRRALGANRAERRRMASIRRKG